MSVQQVVTPGDLGAEFDIGAEEANQIHVKLDGVTVVRGADGKLQAVQLVLNGDGTVSVTPADGLNGWSFDSCCSKPWEKYQGKVCYERVPPLVALGSEQRYRSIQIFDGMQNMDGFTSSLARETGTADPTQIGLRVEVDAIVDAGGGLESRAFRLYFDNVVERLDLSLPNFSNIRGGSGEYLGNFNLMPTSASATQWAIDTVNGTLSPIVSRTSTTAVVWDYRSVAPFDYLEWTMFTPAGSWTSDPDFSSQRAYTRYSGALSGGEVREAFVWDDNGTTLYQDVLDRAMEVNPTIVACP